MLKFNSSGGMESSALEIVFGEKKSRNKAEWKKINKNVTASAKDSHTLIMTTTSRWDRRPLSIQKLLFLS